MTVSVDSVTVFFSHLCSKPVFSSPSFLITGVRPAASSSKVMTIWCYRNLTIIITITCIIIFIIMSALEVFHDYTLYKLTVDIDIISWAAYMIHMIPNVHY